VIFVHHCVILFQIVQQLWLKDFDVIEVCCETVVACDELEVYDCFLSGFILVVFPCSFDVLPPCLVG
jgi:hypothetical protein